MGMTRVEVKAKVKLLVGSTIREREKFNKTLTARQPLRDGRMTHSGDGVVRNRLLPPRLTGERSNRQQRCSSPRLRLRDKWVRTSVQARDPPTSMPLHRCKELVPQSVLTPKGWSRPLRTYRSRLDRKREVCLHPAAGISWIDQLEESAAEPIASMTLIGSRSDLLKGRRNSDFWHRAGNITCEACNMIFLRTDGDFDRTYARGDFQCTTWMCHHCLSEQIARNAAADARDERYRQQARQLQEEAASARPGATGGSDVANSRNARVEMQVSDDEESISGWSEALDDPYQDPFEVEVETPPQKKMKTEPNESSSSSGDAWVVSPLLSRPLRLKAE